VIDQERKRQIKEMYERQIDRVYRIARIYTGDPHDAEDVAESVFLTVIEKEIAFENEEHEKAWFITSVRNRCKDLHKSSWHDKVQLVAPSDIYSEKTDHDTADTTCADIENEPESEAARLLMMLPEDQREAVYLCYYEGYTVKEAAEIMGIKETKLRSALTAAKRSLRRKRDE
jgi:RNA polymerase sigma-70 factor (ECF subfamily)